MQAIGYSTPACKRFSSMLFTAETRSWRRKERRKSLPRPSRFEVAHSCNSGVALYVVNPFFPLRQTAKGIHQGGTGYASALWNRRISAPATKANLPAETLWKAPWEMVPRRLEKKDTGRASAPSIASAPQKVNGVVWHWLCQCCFLRSWERCQQKVRPDGKLPLKRSCWRGLALEHCRKALQL